MDSSKSEERLAGFSALIDQPLPINVLLLEHNSELAKTIENLISKDWGRAFIIHHRESLSSGLAQLGEKKIDVLLLDLSLPDFQGIESIECLREKAPDIPIITLATREEEPLATEAVLHGVEEYIFKEEMDSRILAYALQHAILGYKKAEKTLRESEALYRRFFQTSRDGVFIIGKEGHIVDINYTGLQLLGVQKKHELNNRKESGIFAHQADLDGFLRVLNHQAVVRDYPINLKGHDGMEIQCQLTAVAIVDDHGNIAGYQGTIRDLTHQKSLEKQLVQAQKMETVGTFAEGIAHDFNNLLTAIMGNLEYMKNDLATDDPNQETLLALASATHRGKELVRQLMQFGRPEQFEEEVLSLNQVIEETMNLLRAVIPSTIEICRHFAEDDCPIVADHAALSMVLTNLSVNARDAMPDGGTLSFETSRVTIDEEFCREHIDATPGVSCLLKISDTGNGIPAEIRERIFEPFFTTKEKGQGTGLGLSMVYSMVKHAGGWLSVSSEPGAGTEFRIYFPRSLGKYEKEPAHEEDICGGNELILFADDEDMIVKLGQKILEKHGYRVVTARDGDEALGLIREKDIDLSLAIIDLTMPGGGGLRVQKALLKHFPELPVIMTSGYSARDMENNLNVKHFLPKPFSPRQILQIISRTLKEKNLSPREEHEAQPSPC